MLQMIFGSNTLLAIRIHMFIPSNEVRLFSTGGDSMSVVMVKILDSNRNIHGMPQSVATHNYPVISHNSTCEIQGAELIQRWVDVIKKQAKK